MVLTAEQIRELSPEDFKLRLSQLNNEFSRINQELLTPIAIELKMMRENCRHHNTEKLPDACFCHDCGEYYKVNTSFSLEVEEWFREQNRAANLAPEIR